MSGDLLRLHRVCLADATGVVERVSAADLDRPTPCAAWTLRQLLEHMVGQHLGFAKAAADAYRPRTFDTGVWSASVDELVRAFAGADLDAEVVEVELHPTRPLPISVLLQAQLLDTAVHTWDLAASLGERYEPDAEIVAAVARVAQPIPDDERREAPGAAFGRAVAASGSLWAETLGSLGRDPAWTA